MLCTAYPDLFALPEKSNFGLPLESPSWRRFAARAKRKVSRVLRRRFGIPMHNSSLNNIDFKEGIRSHPDLRFRE